MKVLFLRHCETQGVGSWAEGEIHDDVPDETARYWIEKGFAEEYQEPPPQKPTPRTNQKAKPAAIKSPVS